jgi:cell division protein ZapA
MAQVTLRINGYAYTIGCRDGEEQHLQAMAGEVERRIESIKSVAGQSGEARMLVMAALMMADDLYELGQRLAAAESARSGGEAKPDPRLGRKLSRMAKRAEDIAEGLEHP